MFSLVGSLIFLNINIYLLNFHKLLVFCSKKEYILRLRPPPPPNHPPKTMLEFGEGRIVHQLLQR